MRTLLLLLLLLPATVAADEIYRSTDDEGNPLFTDDPPSDDAEPVELDPLTTVPATESGSSTRSGQRDGAPGDGAAPDDAPPYRGITVTYPPADQAVRHNGGIVPFRVALEPAETALRAGHEVQILLDGEVRGSGAKLQVSVSPVNRGPHTVRARVVDASGGAIVTSDPVDFVLLRAALGNQAGGGNGGD